MTANSECEETVGARRARPRAFSRPGAVAHMPRFSLRQLLLATILVGIGLGMLVFGTDGINRARDLVVLPLLMIGAGCSAVGFGAHALFRRPQVSLLVGMALFFCIMIFYGHK
jgi:hypothetical protein